MYDLMTRLVEAESSAKSQKYVDASERVENLIQE